MTNHTCIIIGSGPAGVSAAFPLVTAGHDVLMIDVGHKQQSNRTFTGDFLTLRESKHRQSDVFFGDDLSGLVSEKLHSPKLRAPGYRYVFKDFQKHYSIETHNFMLTGSLAKGGLSNAWGAVCYTYQPHEIHLRNEDYQALLTSYENIAKRIGISGNHQDALNPHFSKNIPLQAPLALHPNCDILYKRYQQQSKTKNFQLGQPRTAVITQGHENRKACELKNMCLWGCSNQSIYSAQQDVLKLKSYKNFRYKAALFVQQIIKSNTGYTLICENTLSKEITQLHCKTLILAAGTIGSTSLILNLTKHYDTPVRLLSNPCFAMGFLLPKRLGSAITQQTFGMGQLAFSTPIHESDYAIGTLYTPEALLANELLHFMPFTRPGARALTKQLLPAMLLANCFLPGRFSKHHITLTQQNKLRITGGFTETHHDIQKRVIKRLKTTLRKLGAFLIPMSCKTPMPGTDIHYAGTLPMSDEKKPLTVNRFGQLADYENLYIVDGSILPELPAKNLTFSIMANADRIGQHIAEKIG